MDLDAAQESVRIDASQLAEPVDRSAEQVHQAFAQVGDLDSALHAGGEDGNPERTVCGGLRIGAPASTDPERDAGRRESALQLWIGPQAPRVAAAEDVPGLGPIRTGASRPVAGGKQGAALQLHAATRTEILGPQARLAEQ